MAKTVKKIYSQVYAFENLLKSYRQAKLGKVSRPSVISLEWCFEKLLFQIKSELEDNCYKPGKYGSFKVFDPKERQIYVAPFKDRIVHHALCNVIEPIFDRGFIFDSYACRKRKGNHKAVLRIRKFMQRLGTDFYILKCDIEKYFDSIDKNLLISFIRRKIADKDILSLINKIVYSLPEKGGLPIGNLTSQLFANIYLNELDQFIKQELKAKFYCRYVDDFVLMSENRNQLTIWRQEIRKFLDNKLLLKLHPKKQEIFPSRIGVDFLGYHVFNNHILVRQTTVRRCFKKIKTSHFNCQSYQSYLGHFQLADSFGLIKKVGQAYAQRYANF